MPSATTTGFEDPESSKTGLVAGNSGPTYGTKSSAPALPPLRSSWTQGDAHKPPSNDSNQDTHSPVPPSDSNTKEPISQEEKKTNEKRRWLIFHICVLAFLDMTAYAMCLVPFTTLYRELSITQGGSGSTSESQTFQTICVVLTSVFAFVGGPVIGGLSDSFGRFPAVLFTRFMRILFALCAVLVDAYKSVPGITALLFIGYSIQGLCDPDMCIAIFYAMIADTFSAKARTFYFGLVSSVFAAPVIVGPFIGTWIQQAYGPGLVFQIALMLLAVNGVYVSIVFPETLVDAPKGIPEKCKVMRANSNPFAFCRDLTKTTKNTPYPLLACIAVYACFGVASAALQSTILIYVEDAHTLGFSEAEASYLLSGFGLLLVLSQSVGTKVLLCFLSEQVTITIGMWVMFAGLVLMCVVGSLVVPFLVGLVCTGLGYVVVPSLNGFVSKKTPVADQGTILACLASVRSISLGMGQLGGGAILVWFTSPDAPFALPGFHFLVAALFAAIGGGVMIYVCFFMLRQTRNASLMGTPTGDGDEEEARQPALSEIGRGAQQASFGSVGSNVNRERTSSKGGLLVRAIWGRDNSISLNETSNTAFGLPGHHGGSFRSMGNRDKALSTDQRLRPNRPVSFSTGASIPGVR